MTGPQTFAPRPYQTAAIQALTQGWADGPHNRLAVVLPTGAGKTVVFANLIDQQLAHTRGRTLVIAHREELLEQAAAKIRAVRPDLRVGIVKAERDEHHDANVIVASVQTLAVQRRREAIRDIGMVIVDECHHAAARTYMEVLKHFGAWHGIPVAGFTATMTRGDGGLDEVWQDVVFTLDILDMISDGYLVDVKAKRILIDGLDLDQVKTRNGDLQEGQLGQALEEADAGPVTADGYKRFAADRPGVVFTPTVETAQSMADHFTAAGITAAPVWGDMGREARRHTLERYRRGDVQVLTNCMVLTEGFDAPWTSCVVIARPTKSPGLYCQMAGRGLRLSPETGKTDALILDVMGASTRHRLASIVDLTSREAGEAPEDKPLTEIVEEEAQRQKQRRKLAVAQAEWEEVDVFGRSSSRWLRTTGGMWFIPVTDDAFLFLKRDAAEGGYRVRRWTKTHGFQPPQDDKVLPLSNAMRFAENAARTLATYLEARSLTTKGASWRARPASDKAVNFCRRLGIQVPPGATSGDTSDLIAAHRVSQILARSRTKLEILL
jgi:superfamily II DNA or RNA helicase